MLDWLPVHVEENARMHGKNEKQAFAARLREALAKVTITGPTQLALKFNLLYSGQPISAQAAHNWLNGTAIPTTDKILTLAKWLEVEPHWLRYGTPDDMKPLAAAHPEVRFDFTAEDMAILDKFHRLDAGKKRLVKALLRALVQE
jgi:transcriptional regulator with XRE-family HTH domain